MEATPRSASVETVAPAATAPAKGAADSGHEGDFTTSLDGR